MILGALLSLTSAFSFSVNSILIRRGIAGAGATASQGALITVVLGVPFGFIAVLVTGQVLRFGEVSPMGYLLLFGAGVVHFVIGRYCNYRAIGAIGASRSSPLQAFATPYSILMAVILLDEVVTPLMLAAIGLVLLAPAVMIERRPRTPAPAAVSRGAVGDTPVPRDKALEIRQLEGYIFASLAGIAYGTSPLFIRAALADATGMAAIGTFVAYVSAAAVLLATMALPGRRQLMRSINPYYIRLFGGAGFSVFFAQLLRFFALSMADVVVVAPLQRMVGVFTIILTYLVNRSVETITPRVVLGVLVSISASALLVYASNAS